MGKANHIAVMSHVFHLLGPVNQERHCSRSMCQFSKMRIRRGTVECVTDTVCWRWSKNRGTHFEAIAQTVYCRETRVVVVDEGSGAMAYPPRVWILLMIPTFWSCMTAISIIVVVLAMMLLCMQDSWLPWRERSRHALASRRRRQTAYCFGSFYAVSKVLRAKRACGSFDGSSLLPFPAL